MPTLEAIAEEIDTLRRFIEHAPRDPGHVEHGKGYLRGPAFASWAFSWEAVTRAVNTGEPLEL